MAIETGANATVDGCTFDDDTASNGAGIFNQGTTTVSDCTLSGDSAGSSTLYNGGQLSVTGSTFSDDAGGSGALDNQVGYSYVGNCTFSDDSASNGGGISNAGGATLVLKNSTIEYCSVAGIGGGINSAGLCRRGHS